ncbi:MAG TPA: glycosyltransferase [Nocardioides sp.]|nr:glycosyltransferase [Nocardioides sp.]
MVPDQVRKFLGKAPDGMLLEPGAAPGRHARVAVVVRDRLGLRGLVAPDGVVARAVAVFVEHAPGPVTVVPPPTWPRLTRQRARPAAGGWLTVLRFAADVDVAAVLGELGRQAVHGGSGDSGPVPQPRTGPGSPPHRLDPRILNPIGFDPTATEPVVDAATLDLREGATERLVDELRPAAGVRVGSWDDATVRAVAGLAMAGIPVTAATAPAEALGEEVAAAITAPVDLADPLAREEHSLVLRRAALDVYAPTGQPAVSIVLATRRPDMLEFAVDQVARQRGVDALELVLAPHGFAVDEGTVRDRLGPDTTLRITPQPEDTIFGEVLDAAARAADGDVILKMDDDDWYAPDAVADLLRARAYSGADLVGMPPEFHYLEERDLTVRRGHPSERYATFVAGGTMMVDRSVLREVGGFRPVRKYVDAQLLEAVLAAGGAIYRTHGLGYLLRRTSSGHTWQVDLDYLLDPDRVAATYEGFRPSRLMGHISKPSSRSRSEP